MQFIGSHNLLGFLRNLAVLRRQELGTDGGIQNIPERLFKQVAAAAGLDKYRALRSFTAAFGLTPMRYLASLRVEAAREALAAGASCVDAAWAAGFSDQAHLTRAFKERLGMTPGFYQRAIAGADPADALASSPEQVRP